MKKIMIVAGEVSGDIHSEKVVKALKRLKPEIEIFGIGGDRMRDAGMELIYHIDKMSFLGFLEVVRHLPFIWKVMNHLTRLLDERQPDLVILVDYPGFNLRFAKRISEKSIPVLYYISPQVWAWNTGRVHKIANIVDKLAVIFPFEVDFYQEKNVDLDIEFVGHPLLEEIDFDSVLSREEMCTTFSIPPDEKILGILPGSRKQEIQRILPTLLKTASRLHKKLDQNLTVFIAVAPNIPIEFIEKYTKKYSFRIEAVKEHTHDIMKTSELLLVTSGTATLESSLFATPMIVVYKVTWLSYQIGKRVIQIDNIGLVNVVAQKTIVPEFVQYDATPKKIAPVAYELLTDETKRQAMIAQLKRIREKLGMGEPSRRVGEIALEMTK